MDIRYFSQDFDILHWLSAAPIHPAVHGDRKPAGLLEEHERWSGFFRKHCTGKFFKPRKYLRKEFCQYLNDIKTLIEVGCGHGCSLYPLLLDLPGIERYYATDYSPDALNIMTHHAEYDASRITSTLWDFTRPPPETLPQVEAVLCVFVMSAITPMMHKECLDNVASVLIPGGYLLFRDYGVCDMTMYRHSYCHEKYLFERTDGTYAYYFSIEYIEDLVARSGHFRVLELEYATVFMRNRKSETTGRRVFVHGVLQKL